jgi:hypothetical protein
MWIKIQTLKSCEDGIIALGNWSKTELTDEYIGTIPRCWQYEYPEIDSPMNIVVSTYNSDHVPYVINPKYLECSLQKPVESINNLWGNASTHSYNVYKKKLLIIY